MVHVVLLSGLMALAVGLFLPDEVKAQAAWLDPDWRYQREIIVDNSGNAAKTDYQVKAQAGGNDIGRMRSGIDDPGQVFLFNMQEMVNVSQITNATALREQDDIVHDPNDPNLSTNPEREYKFYFSTRIRGERRIYVVFSADGESWGEPVKVKMGAKDRLSEDPSVVQLLSPRGQVYRDNNDKMYLYAEDFTTATIYGYESTDGIDFTEMSGNPVIDRGGAGSWEERLTGSPVSRHDGTNFLIGYEGIPDNGRGGWGFPESFGMAVGTAANRLTKNGNNPLFTPADHALARQSIVVDGFYLNDAEDAFYFTIHSGRSDGATIFRARATNTDPTTWDDKDIEEFGVGYVDPKIRNDFTMALHHGLKRLITTTTDDNSLVTFEISGPAAAQQITLRPIGTFATGVPFGGAAEIVAHDPETQRLFVVNAPGARIDILDISDPTNPAALTSIDVSPYGAAPTSVATHGSVVAVAVENETKTEPGAVVFFNTEGQFLSSVTVGALPDMLTFAPNGRKVLVANEGEPNDDYTIDPEGSVSIINVSAGAANITQEDVCTAGFGRFNDAELDPRIRIFGPNASVAQDLEPEYITVSDDSDKAWVTLQENNALAILDLEACQVTELVALGFKDHNLPRNGLDASDVDGINITSWPVQGMYQPDGIGSYCSEGATYLVTANEGDSRNYPGFSEEARVADLPLDPTAFPDAANLQQEDQLGRLKVTRATGDTDGDGDFDQLFSHGARSFSIWTEDGELVFDSGDAFEQITAEEFPDGFNGQDTVDDRSDDKGPEPEGIVLGEAFGRTYGFIGLERTGGIMVYDISDPSSPSFVQYINTRILGGDPGAGTAGDVSPEGLTFIEEEDSPNGSPLLVVAYEVSGTTTIFEITKPEDDGA